MPYLKAAPRLKLRHTSKRGSILCGNEIFEIDSPGEDILSLCEGACKKEEIINKLSQKYGLPREEIAEAAETFINTILENASPEKEKYHQKSPILEAKTDQPPLYWKLSINTVKTAFTASTDWIMTTIMSSVTGR